MARSLDNHPPAAAADLPSPLAAAELALQLGALLLQSGASATRAVKVLGEVLGALGLPRAEVALTPELMTVVAGDGALPQPVARATPQIRWNIDRLSRLEGLVGTFLAGAGGHRQLREDLAGIAAQPSPYPPWMRIVAAAALGIALSRLLDADWSGTAVAALACAVGQSVRGRFASQRSLGLTTLIGAVVAAVVGALAVRFQLSQTPVATLTGAVAFLVPGLWLITGGLDVLGGRQLRFGLLRLTVAFLLFGIIVLGVAAAQAILS